MVKSSDSDDLYEYLNSPIFSSETLKGISALYGSFKIYEEKNKGIFAQLLKTGTLSGSTLEGVKLSAVSDIFRILANKSNFTAFGGTKNSPIFEYVNAANLSISKLLREVDSPNISKLIQQISLPSSAWETKFQAMDKISGGSQRYDLVVQSHLSEISKFSALSQISLSHLTLESSIGNAFKVDLSVQSNLQRTFTDFAKSYSKLFASFSDNPLSIISLPPIVSRYSAIEFFNGVRFAESITIGSDESELGIELGKEVHQLERDIQQENKSVLEELLGSLNVGFIAPLHGARQSLESTNPDKVRHFSTSLRELFTHVLHALSPNEKVKNWDTSPQYYDQGRPTRRARLLYICRSLNHEPFSDFLQKDIDTILEFLNLFQRGTHEIEPTYTDFQLRLMLTRMETTLIFLLEIWKESNIL
jgi:Predicted pPIWI-associating nuclease